MLAKAMGNKVTVISTSNTKKDLANRMGADVFVNSKNPEDTADPVRQDFGFLHVRTAR